MQVLYYCSKDSINSFVTDKESIDSICNIMDGKVEKNIKQSKPGGNILYYSNNEIIFDSYFNTGNDCEQLSYFISPQWYNTMFTYGAGMFLSKIGSGLKYKNYSQQSIAASRAGSYFLSIILQPIFCHRLDDLQLKFNFK